MAELIHEVVEEGKERRGDDEVAGVERILNLNPYEPPTRKAQRSTKPMFLVASKQARVDLQAELVVFLAQYREASAALRSGNLEAAGWFPDGCYPPALAFVGSPAPRRPPLPPTRRITTLDSGEIEHGEIPVVEISVSTWSAKFQARARGQPP